MTKRGITNCLLAIGLIIYLMISLSLANNLADEAPCRGVAITVAENDLSAFVTPDDIDSELGGIRADAHSMRASEFNLQDIENRLEGMSILESANAVRRNDDTIAIHVVPMVPRARVFTPEGSYYLNRDGKRLEANIRYQVDVPVVVVADSAGDARSVLPLIERINNNDTWNRLVTAIKVDRNADILLVPSISGHIINFGDTSAIDDKFHRLFTFYRKVMPLKGWNYYDTISVKYARQVVATITPGARRQIVNQYADSDFIEIPYADDENVAQNLNIIKHRL